MGPVLLEKAILDRKAVTGKFPKAIVPVALYGMLYKIDEIMATTGIIWHSGSDVCRPLTDEDVRYVVEFIREAIG